ncbi:restriction endonuclease subunit S [Sorangium sp. So ce269]
MSELKPGWRRVKFGEVATHIAERAEPTPEETALYVGLEHLDSGSLTVRRWGSQTELIGTKLRMRKGDILFARRNAYLRRVAIAPHDGLFSAHGMVLRPRPPHIAPEFLPFFMQSDLFMDRAEKISVGSLSPTINWSSLRDEEFALPPLEEQRRLSKALQALSNLDATLQDCENAAKRISDAVAAGSFPVATTDDRTSALGDLCTEITVGIVIQPARWYVPPNQGVVALIMKNVQRGWIDMGDVTYISHEGHSAHSKSILRKGDVIAVRSSGSVERTGDAAVVPAELDGANCIDLLIARPGPGLLPEYVCEYLNAPTTRSVLVGTSSGTMQKHLNVGALKKLRIPAVGTDEQQRVVGQLRELKTAVRLKSARRTQLQHVRRQVFAALTGEVSQ